MFVGTKQQKSGQIITSHEKTRTDNQTNLLLLIFDWMMIDEYPSFYKVFTQLLTW